MSVFKISWSNFLTRLQKSESILQFYFDVTYTRVGNVCPGRPVYGVKCLFQRAGMRKGGGDSH